MPGRRVNDGVDLDASEPINKWLPRRAHTQHRMGFLASSSPRPVSMYMRRTPSVSPMGPGEMVFTRILSGPHSTPSVRDSDSMPALAAAQWAAPGQPVTPNMVTMLMIVPPCGDCFR